jgi:uncharacterized protein with PhoU and TrkA domain
MSEKEAEEVLLELKEKAELMVDLAYSSVLYDNREIAEEVYELENFVDELNEKFRELAIKDVKNGELAMNEALAMIQLAMCSEMIADAAQEIADVKLRDVELHPILKESILESQETLVKTCISSISILCNKRLDEIELASQTGMWVIAIKRNNKWIYGASGSTILYDGDILFARGSKEGREHFIALATGEDKKV